MFDKMSNFIDKYLSGPMGRLAEQRHLRAVRDGIIATLPMIIVSSIFLVIAFLPNQLPESWAITQWIKDNVFKILLPHRMTMFIMTLYAVFGIGYSLARSYKLDGLSGAIISEVAFLLTIVPQVGPEAGDALIELSKNTPELQTYIESVPQGWLLSMGNLGTASMFVGIICSIVAVEIYRFTQEKNISIKLPKEVPASVSRSFESLIPTLFVILLFSTVCLWLEFDMHTMVQSFMEPLLSVSDTLGSVLIIEFIGMLFWVFGIHGWSIVGSIARPLWLMLLDQNMAAVANGTVPTTIASEPFYQWFVNTGSTGLSLAILFLVFSKSKYGKALGKASIVPAVFNINEPIIFGAPIVLNPTLMIPFIFAPMINAVIAWFAMSVGLVNKFIVLAPWTLPGPIGAYIATGGDWRAVILNILLIALSTLIFYPFFKAYDKQLIKDEIGQEE